MTRQSIGYKEGRNTHISRRSAMYGEYVSANPDADLFRLENEVLNLEAELLVCTSPTRNATIVGQLADARQQLRMLKRDNDFSA